MDTTISVFIADDHPMVVEGLEKSICNAEMLTFSGSTGQVEAVVDLVKHNKPDVLLLDYQFTGNKMTGLDVCRQLSTLDIPTQIIVISSFTDVSLIRCFIDSGAKGFILKTAPFNEYADAITTVFSGGLYYSREIRQILINERKSNNEVKFTRTEKEVLKLIAEGLSSKAIAKRLCRERSTIDTHRKNILSKLQLMDDSDGKKSKNIAFYLAKLNLIETLDRY